MFNFFLILFCRFIYYFIRLINIGSGSTWPGHIALLFNKNFIKEILSNSKTKVILVAGTNGKTTTSTLLKFILEHTRYKVFQNEEGANLINGATSALIKSADLFGNLKYDFAIFETDENTLPLILKEITPDSIILLNLFRDQLDRYGEVNTIALNWKKALSKLDQNVKIFLNSDDPLINYLGQKLKAKTYFFGISKKFMKEKELSHDVDSIYCPQCGTKLIYNSISYSHLGDFRCSNCGFSRGSTETFTDQKINYPLYGDYNVYNTNAVTLVIQKILNISLADINKILLKFKPVFGRQEKFIFKNREITILLSKNPTGFNQSIEASYEIAKDQKINYLVAINDRIPDGLDISWIWDVNFESLVRNSKNLFITGDRTYDMGLRIKYCFNSDKLSSNIFIIESLENALNKAVERTKEKESLIILSTYSAMLDIRRILKGRKLI